MQQVQTLSEGIESLTGGTPMVLKVKTRSNGSQMVGGPQSVTEKTEWYICISQLPPELQERVKTAVQMALMP
jgi:hypothetical protein